MPKQTDPLIVAINARITAGETRLLLLTASEVIKEVPELTSFYQLDKKTNRRTFDKYWSNLKRTAKTSVSFEEAKRRKLSYERVENTGDYADRTMTNGITPATVDVFKNVRGFPPGKELAETVYDLSAHTHGKLLCDELPPIKEAGHIVQFSVEYGKHKWFSREDTFSVTDKDGEAMYEGLHIVENANVVGKNRVVIKDKDEKPVSSIDIRFGALLWIRGCCF
jgi:hypothetical protein